MIRFYCEEETMWDKDILSEKGEYAFSSEFLKWCEGKEVMFKSTMFATHGSDVEIPIHKVTKQLWNTTTSKEDSLYMNEEAAMLFKLTWL